VSELRRGFKAWCENAAWGYRRDLGLERHSALDPRALAQHLRIAIWTPEEIPGLDPSAVRHLLQVDPSSWSAVTLTAGGQTVIIVNSSHSPERQNSNLAHELAHVVLKHEATQVFFTPDGMMMMMHYNRVHEAEADCLAGTLLVPRDALLMLLGRGFDDRQLAAHFRVSDQLLRMRKNLTGVERQLNHRSSRAV
jgi:hypothetical protein